MPEILPVSHYYDIDIAQSHAPAQQALLDAKCSACSQCRIHKTKCEWNGDACSACIKSGELCSTAAPVKRTTTHGCSLPPSQPPISAASSAPRSISKPPDMTEQGIGPRHWPASRKQSSDESEINDSSNMRKKLEF